MNNFLFEPLSLEHIPLLHKWMHEPHVGQWWREGKAWIFDELLEKYRSYTLGYKIEQRERKPLSAFIIRRQERPNGFIQMYDAFDFLREGFKIEEPC